MKDLAVIIPYYNEKGSIEVVVSSWVKTLNDLDIDYSINIYDDGSTDGSGELLSKIEKAYPNIKIISKSNSGHGPTILKGYNDNISSTWLLQIDSDDEIKSSEFPEFWIKREEYDFLIGKRKKREDVIARKTISFVAKKLVRILCGKGINDVNCPYRLIKTTTFKKLLETIPENTFAPNILISAYVNIKKIKFIEIPISFEPRQTGVVSIRNFRLLKVSIKSFYQTVMFLISNNFRSLL